VPIGISSKLAEDEGFDQIIVSENKYNKLSYKYSLEQDTEYFYRVKAMSDSNESRWSTGMIRTEKITDINDDHSNSNEFIIYPNPAKNEIVLSFFSIFSGQIKISIYKFARRCHIT
jgi:hypothetical protein